MLPLALVAAFCLTGFARAEYNISKFGMPTRAFDCELPVGCPEYTEIYLANYGYLNPNPTKSCLVQDIRAALVRFQEFFKGTGVNVTGECDEQTIELFKKPRCGCEDMPVDDLKKRMMMMQNFYGPQAYQVGNTKWSKTHLKWKVTKYPVLNSHLSDPVVDDAMKRALDVWAQQTPLTFEKVPANSPADIDIKFERGRHTREPPFYDFDGKGNVLAHAFFPQSGAVHFDDDESFVVNSDQGTELFIVAAHEFGHTLGISHSNINEALMAPFYRYSKNLVLHRDDVQAIQYLYGAGTRPEVITTRAPPRPVPTTPKPSMPDICNMKIQAAFKLGGTIFVFTNDPSANYKTVVYKVNRNGLDLNSKTSLEDLFKKRTATRWPRAHPYRVDAAAYIPRQNYIFLFSGTRAYRYTVTSYGGPFYLDRPRTNPYPRWMNVEEFPERPRAAVPMPIGDNSFYMLIFGRTMMWDWDFETQRVGAWAYPISAFGRNMPTNINTAFLDSLENVVFIKNDEHISFDLRYRRVMNEDSVRSVKRDFFRGQCA